MKYYLILLIFPILCSSFCSKYNRISKRFIVKIKYCPYINNPKNNIIQKYNETTISLNKKLRYLKIINNRNINKIYDENLLDETITSSSTNISEDLVDEIKDSFAFLLDINKEYTTILSLIIAEIIKFKFNQSFNSNANIKKTLQTILFRNILIPMAVHDIFQILFNLLKSIFKH